MQLNAIEFAKLINDLKCDVRPDERRIYPRAPTRAILDVVLLDGQRFGPPALEKIRVRDVSRCGMGLLSNRAISAQARLVVLLPKNTTETLTLLCRVVRNQRLSGDMYHVGAQMVRRVSADDFAGLMRGTPGVIDSMMADAPPVAA